MIFNVDENGVHVSYADDDNVQLKTVRCWTLIQPATVSSYRITETPLAF